MATLKKCPVCERDLASNAKACPHCGAPNKKPFYRQPAFIVSAGIIAVLLGIILYWVITCYMWVADVENGRARLLMQSDSGKISYRNYVRVDDLLTQCEENEHKESQLVGKPVAGLIKVTDIGENEFAMVVNDSKNHIQVEFSSGSYSAYKSLYRVQPGDFVVVAAVIADIDTEEGLLVVNRIGMFQIADEEVEHVDSPFGFVVAPPS